MRVIVWVFVVIAAGRTVCQSSVEERGHEFLHRRVAGSGPDGDSLPGEQIQGTLADAAGNDRLDALLTKPAWKQARLMVGRREHFCAQGQLGIGIDFDERELAAAAEVSVQSTVLERDGDFHELSP